MDRVRPSKRLVVFCDGTWCGRETEVAGSPPSNIRMIANMIGTVEFKDDKNEPTKVYPIHTDQPNMTAGYQEGVGANGTFLEYLWDGATAWTIGEECVSVYKFIVNNYTDDHEIWMFGFSRGSFTVRCVAGMINNCGIIKRRPDDAKLSDTDVDKLCHEVYRTYRSPLDIDHPKSKQSLRFKENEKRVWPVKQPIRFTGLIDTVGALGIPRLNAGLGLDFPEFQFFDQSATSVVQDIYHAPSLHDRLWAFAPCLILPPKKDEAKVPQGLLGTENGDHEDLEAKIHQVWFPGTHYDVGRQTFRFIRQTPANWIEGLLGWLPDLLSRTVRPNQVLSDLVLRWILEGVRDVDRGSASHKSKPNSIIPSIQVEIDKASKRLAEPLPNTTGSGDIYGNVLDYGPTGLVLGKFQRLFSGINSALNSVFPMLGDNIQDLLGIKQIIGILAATNDRKIPGNAAHVYPYTSEENGWVNGQQVRFSIEDNARMKAKQESGDVRYPSKTWESFQLWKKVYGQPVGEAELMIDGRVH